MTFAKSKRTYTLTRVEMALREAKKGQLFASMSDPLASVGQPDPDSTVSEARACCVFALSSIVVGRLM